MRRMKPCSSRQAHHWDIISPLCFCGGGSLSRLNVVDQEMVICIGQHCLELKGGNGGCCLLRVGKKLHCVLSSEHEHIFGIRHTLELGNKNRDQKTWHPETRQDSRLFLCPEIGQFSPHFRAIALINYTETWRKPRVAFFLSLVVVERVLKGRSTNSMGTSFLHRLASYSPQAFMLLWPYVMLALHRRPQRVQAGSLIANLCVTKNTFVKTISVFNVFLL